MDVILPVAGLGTQAPPANLEQAQTAGFAGRQDHSGTRPRSRPADPLPIRSSSSPDISAATSKPGRREHITIPVAFVQADRDAGQTDAIIRARDISRDDALILFPDMLFEADFSIIDRSDADVIMFTKEVEDPSALGIAVVENGQIVRLVEKPKEPISKLAVIGIYYIRSMPALYEAIDEQMERGIKTKNEYFIADAIQIMIDKGAKVISAPVTLWEDCGNAQSLLSTNRILLTRDRDEERIETRGNSVIIHPSVVDRICASGAFDRWAVRQRWRELPHRRLDGHRLDYRGRGERRGSQLTGSIVGFGAIGARAGGLDQRRRREHDRACERATGPTGTN